MTKRIAVVGATGRAGRHVVDVLTARGHEVVPISRSHGVDVITGKGLADALAGVDAIIDVATGPSPEEQPATEFFTTAARHLQAAGAPLIVAASIIGVEHSRGGYGAAKRAHERALLEGPSPVRILRAAQFHELVGQLLQWGERRGDAVVVPKMRTQLVAAEAVAEVLADLALAAEAPAISEVAGPREENLAEMARLAVGDELRVEERSDPTEAELYESGTLLPGPDAILAGPTFAEWLTRERSAAPR
jgi:uncharacterized protein YbjT (DUF2867 family)